jgi:DNA-binding XRE family transcriptional regulator
MHLVRKRQNLINARKGANMTQGALGALIGATKQRISNLEKAISSTRPEIWDKLEDVLGVPQRKLREITEVPADSKS